MTDEVTNDAEISTAPDGENVQLSVEQILAAVLSKVGKQNIEIPELLKNYSSYSIAVNQEDDGTVSFDLVEAPKAEDTEESEVLEVEPQAE